MAQPHLSDSRAVKPDSSSPHMHWGYPDPSLAAGGEAEKRVAFELTRQAISYRMLQLMQLPLDTLDNESLKQALLEIAKQ